MNTLTVIRVRQPSFGMSLEGSSNFTQKQGWQIQDEIRRIHWLSEYFKLKSTGQRYPPTLSGCEPSPISETRWGFSFSFSAIR